MLQNSLLIEYIEKLRQSKNLTIIDLTKNITSRRTYTRYQAGELDVPFEVFAKYLLRLDMVVKDFVIYAYNDINHSNMYEYVFYEYVRLGYYKEAKEQVYPLIKDKEFRTDLKEVVVPLSVVKMKYETGDISKFDYLKQASNIMQLDQIFSSRAVTKNDIEAISLYVEDCSNEDRFKIIKHLEQFNNNDQARVISVRPDLTIVKIPFCSLKALILSKEYSEENMRKIQMYYLSVIELNDIHKLEPMYDELFKLMYTYYKDTNQNELLKKTMFYFISSICSRSDNVERLSEPLLQDESVQNEFVNMLSDKALLNSTLKHEVGETK